MMQAKRLFLLVIIALGMPGEVLAGTVPVPAGHESHGQTPITAVQRLLLLADAERALALGDTGKAQTKLEIAAQLEHAADIEMSQIRTMMQAGEYRHALAFAAHTAGVHVDEGLAPTALYAWLLSLGGQDSFAKRILAEAANRFPHHDLLAQMDSLLDNKQIPMARSLLKPPHRMAPYPVLLGGTLLPGNARITGNAVLWLDGRKALAPMSAIGNAQRAWLRNGLGQTVSATVEHSVDELQLVLLSLDTSLPNAGVSWANKDAFAGSQGFAVDYPPVSHTDPAWPALHPGFLGRTINHSRQRRLGIAMPKRPRGGPVFDAYGQVAGIAATNGQGTDILIDASQLYQALAIPVPTQPGLSQAKIPVPVDESYEKSLYSALQVIIPDTETNPAMP